MAARHAAFACVLLCLLITLPSNLELVVAATPPLRLTAVCHDNCWQEAEYCGRDAYVTTGVADMNHDCVVDGLDLALFYPQYLGALTGSGLSGDFDNNNQVGLSDINIMSNSLGRTASPGHRIPIPTVCDGTISLSFSNRTAPIVNNASQAPGSHFASVVVSGVTSLQAVEFGITTSSNITNVSVTTTGTGGAMSVDSYFGYMSAPVTGAAIVARIDYDLTDSNPATIVIATTTPWARNRWTTPGAPVSHEFASVNAAGINGPTPPSTASCVATGTISGTVHNETGSDCAFNGGDTAASERLVMAMPGPSFGYTDANGNYSIAVAPGQYQVSMFNNVPSSCQTSPLPVTVTASQTSAGNDFAITSKLCHDGVWDDGEYCGRDAYATTGVPDMNHDCLVDGLDYVMFALQNPGCGPELSGDLNGDGLVDNQDFALLNAGLGNTASPCNPTPIPVQCDGAMQLSFSTNPSLVVNNATQAPNASYFVWLIVNGVTNAKAIEFFIQASPNVAMSNVTWFGVSGPSTFSSGSQWGVAFFGAPFTGSSVVARIQYYLSDSNPATISIAEPPASKPWVRNRWTTAAVNVSHEFALVTSVGINGPTPGLTPCGSVGQIAGTVYSDPNNDCVFNGGDTKLQNLAVRADPGPYFAYTDANGDYSFSLPPTTYTVSMAGFNAPWNALSSCQSPKTYTVNLTANTTFPGNDFALQPNGTITGRVYSDGTTPCVFDVGADVGLFGRRVEANPGSYVAYTDLNGNYSLTVPVGSYTVTQVAPFSDPWVYPSCFSGSYPVTVVANTMYGGRDFPLNLNGSACNMTTRIVSNGVSMGPPPCQHTAVRGPCPGSEQEYLVWVWGDPNLSNATIPANRTITITLDPAFTINSVTGDCPFTVLSSSPANTRVIQFTSAIPPGTQCTLKVHATPSTMGPYTHVVSFSPGMACGGTLVTSLNEVANCIACDPNDMYVQPGCGANGEVLADVPLTYTAKFENIGLGAAQNIVIEDILDAHLDPNTVHIVASSHPVTGVQLEAGNKLVIRFANINLPGTTDPDHNHGYVIYSVNQDPGLPDGTTIHNSASIYFDFNDAVVTNTALSTVRDNPCVTTPVGQPPLPLANYLGLNHPNPFNPATTIEYGLTSAGLVSINIYNVRGELIRTLVHERKVPGWYSVDWDGRDQGGNPVASGVYLDRMSAGSFVSTKKLVLLK